MANISLIIINDNGESYCPRLFQSIKEQISNLSIELVFIDNFSSDNSIQLAEEFGIMNIYAFNEKASSRSQLYNKGCELSNGDYIIFSHSDIYFAHDFFRNINKEIEKEKFDFINFPQYYVNGELFGHERLLVNINKQEVTYVQLFQNTPENSDLELNCSEACFMIRKESISNLIFDEHFKDSFFEFDLMLQIIDKHGQVTTFSECYISHYFLELHEKIKSLNEDKTRFINKHIKAKILEKLNTEQQNNIIVGKKVNDVSVWAIKLQNDLQNLTYQIEQKNFESNNQKNEIIKLKQEVYEKDDLIVAHNINIERLQENLQESIFKYENIQRISEINRHSLIQVEVELKRAMSTKAWKLMCLARRINEQLIKGSLSEKKKFLRWFKNKLLKKPVSKELELIQFSPVQMPKSSAIEIEQLQYSKQDKLSTNTISNVSHIDSSYQIYHSPIKVDIFRFPVIEWDFRWQRPQQISVQFALQGHRVFYFSIDTQEINVQDADYQLVANQVILRELQPNIWWVKLCSFNRLNAYRDTIINPEDIKCLNYSLEFLRNKFNIESTISILDLPFWAPLASQLKNNKVIYDCMDDHAGFSTNTAHELTSEEQLIENADLVLASSQRLYEKIKNKNHLTALIRNAGEFNHFSKQPSSLAEELKDLTGPIIGYYGAISEWFDIKLIDKLARNNKKWNFVLIGDTFGCDTSATEKLENVRFLGEKPYNELPKYLYLFDVCLIPFLVSNLTLATNPVKVYEYLAAGKPVVSTRLPELELIGGELVYLASSYDEYELAINNALTDADSLKIQRVEFAKDNTWQSRYIELENAINKQLHPKVSIVIVTFNNWSFTKQCLDSLFTNSCYSNMEIILVDNASTDETRIQLSKIIHPKFKVILSPINTGFAGGNSIGCQAATGEYIILLNNDTIVPRGWIERLIRPIKENKDMGLVGPVSNSVGNDQMLDFFVGDPINGPDLKWLEEFYSQYNQHIRETELLGFFCVAMRREVYEKIGDLDTTFGIGMFEDDDYCERVKNAGYRLAIVEDAFVYHHGSVSFKKLEDSQYRAIFEKNKAYFEKKWNKTWVFPNPPASIFLNAVDTDMIQKRVRDTNKRVILVLGDLNWSIQNTRFKQIVDQIATNNMKIVVVYVHQYHDKDITGIRKFGPNIYFTNRVDLFEEVRFESVIYCGSEYINGITTDRIIIDSSSYLNNDLLDKIKNHQYTLFTDQKVDRIIE